LTKKGVRGGGKDIGVGANPPRVLRKSSYEVTIPDMSHINKAQTLTS